MTSHSPIPNLSLLPVGSLSGHFWIPPYQRGYRWGEHEVATLLKDLHECANLPADQSYCLQPVVVKKRIRNLGDDNPKDIPFNETYHELIDGQQRVTTLYLLYRYLHQLGGTAPAFDICYETRRESAQFLLSVSSTIDHSNIDYFHISTAFNTIQNWFQKKWRDIHQRQNAAKDWNARLNTQIKLIWYDAGQQTSIDLFTRLNSGCIQLTNADLIKALLLADHGNSDAIRLTHRANQWDAVEHALHDHAFWNFLSGDPPYLSRIDLLLDLVASRPQTRNDTFATFDYYRKELLQGKTQQELWDKVWQYYTQLRDWFDDRPIFHRIGWLIASGETLSNVMELCLAYADRSKSTFKKMLDEQISSKLNLQETDLKTLGYETEDGKRKCNQLLLLFNVLSVDQLESEDQRYPFSVHRDQQWSLEHIHARAAQPLGDNEAWIKWLEDSMTTLKSIQSINEQDRKSIKSLEVKVGQAVETKEIKRESFFDIQNQIINLLNKLNFITDHDGLGNLALLEANINSALGNQSFPAKRRRLLEYDKRGIFIPICTRRAFLKYYTDAPNQHLWFWSDADYKAYYDELVSAIRPYLKAKEV